MNWIEVDRGFEMFVTHFIYIYIYIYIFIFIYIYIYIIYIYNKTSVAILPQVFVIPCLSGMYQKSDGGVERI